MQREDERMEAPAVPNRMAEGAEALVARLGMERELGVMLDWVRRNVTGLVGIRIEISRPRCRHEDERHLIIRAHRDVPFEQALKELIDWEWSGWKAQTFPPRVCKHFVMASTFIPFPEEEVVPRAAS